jgi:hypothetical protein
MSLEKLNCNSKYLIISIYYERNYTYINNIIFNLFDEYKYNKYWYIIKSHNKNKLKYFIYSQNLSINIKKISHIFNYLFDLTNPINKSIYVYFGCYEKKIFITELNKCDHDKLLYFIKNDKSWDNIDINHYTSVLK